MRCLCLNNFLKMLFEEKIYTFVTNTEINPQGVAQVANDSHAFHEVRPCSVFHSLAFKLNWIHSVVVICTRLCEKHFQLITYQRIAEQHFRYFFPPFAVINENFIAVVFFSGSYFSLLAFSKKVFLWCFQPTALISQRWVPLLDANQKSWRLHCCVIHLFLLVCWLAPHDPYLKTYTIVQLWAFSA